VVPEREWVLLLVVAARFSSSLGDRAELFHPGNFFEITRFSVELGLLAVALTPVIVAGGIDLSVGSMMGSPVSFERISRVASGASAGGRLRKSSWASRRRAECAAHLRSCSFRR